MTFLELARSRYSVRAFKPDPIGEEALLRILEAGRVAPTAKNLQPQRIYVIRSRAVREKLASVCRFTYGAPVILAICRDRNREWKNELMPGYGSGETDAAIVTTHMMLAAWEQGIGSCWVGYFDADRIAGALELPGEIGVCALLPLGYPADGAKPAPMHDSIREFEDTISFL